MKNWKLIYDHFVPEEEPLRETLTTLGNGYFGTRGAACEMRASKIHYPGTYVAGIYNELPTNISGKTIYNEDFVNCPNWLMFNYRINDGPWFEYSKVKILDYKVELNMRLGILYKQVRFQDSKGCITLVKHCRIVSMADPHTGAFRVTLTPENYSGKITVRSGIDGQIINEGVDRYKQLNKKHLDTLTVGQFGNDGIYLQSKTNQSNIRISEAMRTLVYKKKKQYFPELKIIKNGKVRCMHELTMHVKKGDCYSVEKIATIYTSRDQGVSNDCQEAIKRNNNIASFKQLIEAHKAKWIALWSRFDIEIKGNDFIQTVLRLHIFHLLQSASIYNLNIDAGMPVRGLHGEAYRGHIFWDELYIFPFYNLHVPEITRALLMYRYRRLGAAKDYANKHGYRGAMYPWQTASTGEETTQIIHLNPISGTWGPDYSSNQRHVSIAVAYNVWSYYCTTGDIDFMNYFGGEIMVEIAHFWSSIAKYNKKIKRYEISGVMGPDEFHEKYPGSRGGGLKNNAYTNIMAVWVIEKALVILDKLLSSEDRTALLLKTGIDKKELSRWQDIIHKMVIPIDRDGIIHQFEGYMDLKELDWEAYQKKYDNIHRIDRILKAEGKSPDAYKASKQADVLLLFYILNEKELRKTFKQLGYKFSSNLLKNNYNYYFPRTSHGSTLSMVVHSYVCSLVNDKSKTKELFSATMKSDIYDTQGGTTREGIHAGVMGGSIDVFLRVFAGLNILEGKICLNPNLPKDWKSIKFQVRFKNIWFKVLITSNTTRVKAELVQKTSLRRSIDIPIMIQKKKYRLLSGKSLTVDSNQ
jgi:trehalose/maltose hydrolase-like predicted phosphorylase